MLFAAAIFAYYTYFYFTSTKVKAVCDANMAEAG